MDTVAESQNVTILMALYNGAAHLQEQLDSFTAQDHHRWDLLVSDDGSQDTGPAIVARYAKTSNQHAIRLIEGPSRGSARNFLHLLEQAPPGPVAFSDQDDLWNPDKLSRAMSAVSRASGPAIYSARTTICDENLAPLKGARRFKGPFGFRNALVQCATAGNTIVLNAEGAALLRQAAPAAARADIPAHDWWAYQIITGAGGQVLRDDAEVLLYRQHSSNLMGRNDTPLAAAVRLQKLFAREFGGWLRRNIAALNGARDLLSDENRRILDSFSEALQRPGPLAAMRLKRLGIHRQTRPGTAALMAAAAAGRL